MPEAAPSPAAKRAAARRARILAKGNKRMAFVTGDRGVRDEIAAAAAPVALAPEAEAPALVPPSVQPNEAIPGPASAPGNEAPASAAAFTAPPTHKVAPPLVEIKAPSAAAAAANAKRAALRRARAKGEALPPPPTTTPLTPEQQERKPRANMAPPAAGHGPAAEAGSVADALDGEEIEEVHSRATKVATATVGDSGVQRRQQEQSSRTSSMPLSGPAAKIQAKKDADAAAIVEAKAANALHRRFFGMLRHPVRCETTDVGCFTEYYTASSDVCPGVRSNRSRVRCCSWQHFSLWACSVGPRTCDGSSPARKESR